LTTLRSPTTLFFNFFFPFIFIIVFGLLGQGNQTFDVGVRQASLQQGALFQAIQNVPSLKLITGQPDANITDQLTKGQLSAAITIKDSGTIETSTGKMQKYTLEIEKSAASPQNSEAITSILQSIAQSINSSAGAGALDVIQVSETVVAGRMFREIDFILPGQLAFALLANAIFGISITFVTMRKELIIKRIFATPVRRWNILLSEAASRIVLGVLQTLLIVLVGHYLFHFTLARGVITLLEILALSLIGMFVFLAFGIFVSSVGKTEDAVAPIANLIMLPQLFLSGAFFSIDLFPKFLQPLARILPLTYLNNAFQKVAFGGASIIDTWPMIVGLLIWGAIVYIIDIRIFRWE